jgi:pyruvate-formate lyase-activating enzyme
MNYATIKKMDIANGPGVRVSLFVSGCRHHCKGCFNEEAWDFDYGTFNPDYRYFNVKSSLWYPYLFKYPEFTAAMKARWAEVEEIFKGMDEYIVTIAEKVRESNEINLAMWPISSSVNGDESMTYDDAIATMRAAYQNRLTRVGNNISWM